MSTASGARGRDPRHVSGIRRTAVASAVLLFLECALIRWTASELGGLAFFKNLTLIAAFLGAGWGSRPARGSLG